MNTEANLLKDSLGQLFKTWLAWLVKGSFAQDCPFATRMAFLLI
jgi:hypothetical protein